MSPYIRPAVSSLALLALLLATTSFARAEHAPLHADDDYPVNALAAAIPAPSYEAGAMPLNYAGGRPSLPYDNGYDADGGAAPMRGRRGRRPCPRPTHPYPGGGPPPHHRRGRPYEGAAGRGESRSPSRGRRPRRPGFYGGGGHGGGRHHGRSRSGSRYRHRPRHGRRPHHRHRGHRRHRSRSSSSSSSSGSSSDSSRSRSPRHGHRGRCRRIRHHHRGGDHPRIIGVSRSCDGGCNGSAYPTTTGGSAGPTQASLDGPCSTEGQMKCGPGGGFLTCDHSKWVLRACAAGTLCRPFQGSILCDHAANANAEPCPAAMEGKDRCSASGPGFETCANGIWVRRDCGTNRHCQVAPTGMVQCV